MPKVLIVEPDELLIRQTSEWLESQHFTTELATTGSAAKVLLAKHLYDVIILDWYLSDPSSAELCKWFRSKGSNTPLLTLTKADDLDDKLASFNAGADDCLSKPLELRELTVRLRALRRRDQLNYPHLIQVGDLTINTTMHRASVSGHMLSLTATEFALLEHFAQHPGKVLGAAALLNSVWKDSGGLSSDTVRAYVKRLRQKLDAVGCRDVIENIHGVGYRMNVAKQADFIYPAPVVQSTTSFAPF